MRYRLRHYTHYHYAEPAEMAHNQLRMVLRDVDNQTVIERSVRIRPKPAWAKLQDDVFGNKLLYLELDRPHRDCKIFVSHLVDVTPPVLAAPASTPAWNELTAALDGVDSADSADLHPYRIASRLVTLPAGLNELVAPHFPPGRPVLEAALSLATYIYQQFSFDTEVTTVATPVADVLERRKGVCQDFAHLMIAGLRSLGLPARYVSGYIETLPPPGQPRLVGADASHAWLGLWCGDCGWQDIDPTNNQRPTGQHIVTAWGRDYDDVIPLNGVISGGGKKSELRVRVDVQRTPHQ